jgi:hypothetical protein
MQLGGKTIFPITLSGGPPLDGTDPVSGLKGGTEVARAGVKMIRIYPKWTASNVNAQIQAVKDQLNAASRFGLRAWVGLFDTAENLTKQDLLGTIIDGLKDSPGLGAWKGTDEPLWGAKDAQGLADAYEFIRLHDPAHPVVIIQAPRAKVKGPQGKKIEKPLTVGLLRDYAAAGDIHGVDIYPISHPPGWHAERPNKDISVVGDLADILVQSAPGKEHWMTLQIAWSGVLPPKFVPILPTLKEERFMAYQAIIAGARGLIFFGGDLKQVMSPEDAKAGWNWTFWHRVLKPVVTELNSDSVGPALVAPPAPVNVKANADDIRLTARQNNRFLYLLTVRRHPTRNGPVRISGVPTGIKFGQAMFEYDGKDFRSFKVSNGSFTDPFAPHDAHIYRFKLPS